MKNSGLFGVDWKVDRWLLALLKGLGIIFFAYAWLFLFSQMLY